LQVVFFIIVFLLEVIFQLAINRQPSLMEAGLGAFLGGLQMVGVQLSYFRVTFSFIVITIIRLHLLLKLF
jgi:hypothetical protein